MRNFLLSFVLVCACAAVSVAQAGKYPLQVGDAETVSEISWSPDDRLILTSSGDDNAVRLWDVASGRVLWKRDVSFLQDGTETYAVRVSAWTADGRVVVTGTDNGKLQLWESGTGRLVWNVKAHAGTVKALAASPDGGLLVSCAETKDGKAELKVWDLGGGRLLKDLSAGQKDVRAVRFVEHNRFQTGNGFGLLTTWSSEDFQPLSTKQVFPCGADRRRHSSVYSPDFSFIASQCRDGLVVTNVTTGRVVKRIPAQEHSELPSFSREGNVMLLPDAVGAKIFDLRASRVKEFREFDDGVLNGDGSLVASGPGYRADGTQVFDTRTGRRRAWLVGHPGVIKSLAFSPDGSRFASGGGDHVVRVWETRGGRLLLQLEGHTADVRSVAFGRDGKTLTSRSEQESIVWDASTGSKLSEVKGEQRFADRENRYPSPSGRLALVEEYDKPFRLVNAATNETVREFKYIDQLDNLAFCPDEKRFLVKPWWGGWQLWDIEAGGPLREFDVGYSFHNRVAFHPDGRTFVTGGGGQNIFMFDLETGRALWSLFPVDREEFEGKKVWEARRQDFINRKAESARRADAENAAYKNLVYVTFDHYGDMTPPGEQRMMETPEPKKSKVSKPAADANAVWLRLHNDSPLPVSVPTQSIYLTDGSCFFEFPTGQKAVGLCDGAEVGVRLGLEDRDGAPLRYGFDFGSDETLLPGKSLLFAVPRAVLRDGRAVTLAFTFRNAFEGGAVENFGSASLLKFRESDLPRE